MSPLRRVHPQSSTLSKSSSVIDELSLRRPPSLRLVEMMIRCKDLQPPSEKCCLDTMCVIFERKLGQWKEYDRTEIIHNNSSPNFCRTFSIEQHLDIYDEKFRFDIYIINKNSNDLHDQCLLGKIDVDFSDLIDNDSKIHSSSFPLLASGYSRPRGYLCVTSEVILPTRSKVVFHCGGNGLKKKGVLGSKKPHTFLEISRSIDAVDYHPIYRTPVCWETAEPRWKPFEISLEKLCNSDVGRKIRLSVNYHSKEGPILIGALETNLQELQNVAKSKSRVMSLRKRITDTSKDSMKEKGRIRIYDLIVEHHYTFLDYVRGGCQCKVFVGIDYTLSNGCQESDASFHGKEEGSNIYQLAMRSVLNNFIPYLNKSQISAFGFGAKLSEGTTNEVNHCFPLYGADVSVKTCEDLFTQYFKTLPTLKFAGPTYLTPLLKHVSELVSAQTVSREFQQYSFLIIFTDGVLNDMNEFKKHLSAIRDLPLSILIVGVGPMDLEALECFDSRGENISVIAKAKLNGTLRENAHFFHLKSDSVGSQKMVNEGFTALASQLVTFMKKNGITPNPPVVQQVNGSSQTYEIHELRASMKRRKAPTKPTITNALCGTKCPTCGHAITESTDL